MTKAPPFRLALTGSIGMGKTTTAGMLEAAGVPVWDADKAVHALYARAEGAAAIRAIAPDAVSGDQVDRARLRALVATDPALLAKLEATIHPLIRADRAAFAASNDMAIIAFDIPLLFETGQSGEFDATLVVTAPADVQRARVMERPGMSEAALKAILTRQMPDAEKRARATFIIDTSRGLDAARADVRSMLASIKAGRDA